MSDVLATAEQHDGVLVGSGLRAKMNCVVPGEPVLRHAHPKAHVTVITGHVVAKCDRGEFALIAPEGHLAMFLVEAGEAHSLHAVVPSAYVCVGEEGFDL